MYRRRHRFQRPSKSPISTKTVYPKRTGKCAGCGQPIAPGTQCTQVRLMKKYRFPCDSCGKVPVGKKKYHDTCVPADLNKAMGFDPAKLAPPPNPYARAVSSTPAVAPPPKPPTFNELALAALLALEKAMAFKQVAPEKKKEVEAAIAKYKLIKARALRPGTPAEGEVATSLAIQALIKTVFNA